MINEKMTKRHVYKTKKISKTVFFDGSAQAGVRIENLVTHSVRTFPADKVVIVWSETGRGRKRVFDTSSARVSHADEKGFSVQSGDGLFEVRTDYLEGGDGTLEKRVSLRAARDVFLHCITTDSLPSQGEREFSAPPLRHPLIPAAVARLGQPVYTGDLFVGMATPVGDNGIEQGEVRCVYHTGRLFSQVSEDGVYILPSSVIGAAESEDPDCLRKAFFRYTDTFARPARFRVQFNSWYDNMLDITHERIRDSFTAVAEGFSAVGMRPLDRYVVDDGWTDYTAVGFWAFADKFADGFSREAELVKSLGSSFGVWFGPRGGYSSETFGFARKLSKLGYHINPLSRDICTADPRYIRDLIDKMCGFCEHYGVTYFKIDGFAKRPCPAHGHGHPPAGRDAIAFYTFLWEEWTKGFERLIAAHPEVCINITSYAHCSPWFLKWADYVWMNNAADMGYSGTGDDLAMCLTYRDARYRDLFVARGAQFPASRLYNHEPCYALRNRNTSRKTGLPVTYTDEQFRTYLKCCVMRGSGLQELYFSPAMMDGDKWKIAAETLSFAERNFNVLSSSRFFGGDPEKGEVYGYYAERKGSFALMLRNPGGTPAAASFSFPAAGDISLTLAPYEIRFFTDLE